MGFPARATRQLDDLIARLSGYRDPASKFATARGSVYVRLPGGATVRYKAPRPEHGADFGWQEPSHWTGFLTPDDADRLSVVQARSTPPYRLVRDTDTPRVAVARAGIMRPISGTVSSYETYPRAGMLPLETWLDNTHHFGNEILAVDGEPNWADWIQRAARNEPPPEWSW